MASVAGRPTTETRVYPCTVHTYKFVQLHVVMYMYMYILYMNVYVLMRDERRKEERSKQDQTNKQGKATQHT